MNLIIAALCLAPIQEDRERRWAELEQRKASLNEEFRRQMHAIEKETADLRAAMERRHGEGGDHDLAAVVGELRADVRRLRDEVEALKHGRGHDQPKTEDHLGATLEEFAAAMGRSRGEERQAVAEKLRAWASELAREARKVDGEQRERIMQAIERAEQMVRRVRGAEGERDRPEKREPSRAPDREQLAAKAERIREALKGAEGEDRERLIQKLHEIEKQMGGEKDEHRRPDREHLQAAAEKIRAALKEAEGQDRENLERHLEEIERALEQGEPKAQAWY
jgi:hypothetical protein